MSRAPSAVQEWLLSRRPGTSYLRRTPKGPRPAPGLRWAVALFGHSAPAHRAALARVSGGETAIRRSVRLPTRWQPRSRVELAGRHRMSAMSISLLLSAVSMPARMLSLLRCYSPGRLCSDNKARTTDQCYTKCQTGPVSQPPTQRPTLSASAPILCSACPMKLGPASRSPNSLVRSLLGSVTYHAVPLSEQHCDPRLATPV